MNEEIAKYQGIYSNPSAYPRYGHRNHGARALRILQKWNTRSVLDVGCGFNEFASLVRQQIPDAKVCGVDPACPGADVAAEAVKLPFQPKEFSVVTSFDMLAHLPECEVEAALAEMARVSTAFIFSISHVPSVNKWQGQTLHPTVRPETWWIEKIMQAGGMHIAKEGRFLTGHWQTQSWRVNPTDTVVVVGNGPSVLNSEYGALVDSHTHVVRFNNYKVAGFERHVGTRTSLWSSVGIGRSHFDPTSSPSHSLLIDGEEAKHAEAESMPCERLPRWFYNQVRREVQERSSWKSGFAPEREKLLATSGLLLVVWLLRVKNVKNVRLLGFDHFSKDRSSQHHYWVPSAFKKPAEHDGAAEADMFDDLRAAGKVTYL
jgi:SAM-dependent methyltransferase